MRQSRPSKTSWRMPKRPSTELERLRRSQRDHPQQQQQRGANPVSTHSLAGIHQCYQKVLHILAENDCSMANAFRLANCPRSTLQDFVPIAELKIVDSREHDLAIRDPSSTSVKDLVAICRRRLRRYIPLMANMRREAKLLPLKFDERFYEYNYKMALLVASKTTKQLF